MYIFREVAVPLDIISEIYTLPFYTIFAAFEFHNCVHVHTLASGNPALQISVLSQYSSFLNAARTARSISTWCKFCLDQSLHLISPTIRHHYCSILKTYFWITNHLRRTILEMFACCTKNIPVTFFSWVFSYSEFFYSQLKVRWNCSTNLSLSISLQFWFDLLALLPTVGVCSRRSFLRLWQRPSVFI